jgi:hypothetical protein
MASQSWGQLIATIPVAGTNYTSFTAIKSMLTSATATEASSGFITLPPNFFQRGAIIEIEFNAGMSWASGNTMVFTINVGSVAAIVSSTFKVTTTGGTTEPLYGKVRATCRAQGNGTIANLIAQGFVLGRGICPAGATAGANYTAGMGSASWTEATPAVGTGFDSTVANTLDFLCTMGTNSASNGFQLQEYTVKSWGNTSV